MPIYEYKCNHCDTDFETLVIGSSVPQCPECDSQDLTRLMSACGFISKTTTAAGETSVKSSGSSACGSCSASSCSSCGIG
mgnify:CR=1